MEFIAYNDYILNETYESFVELKMLVNDILNAYNTNKINVYDIYALAKFTKRSYKILSKEFLFKTGFIIGRIYAGGTSKGRFFPPSQYTECKTFLNPYKHKQSIFFKDPLSKYTNGTIIIWEDSIHNNTIIHELQHAWDNYRSKGKFDISTSANKFRETLKKKEDLSKNDTLELYVRSAHEISAFFIAAINDLDFFYSKDTDFKSFKVMYDEFKSIYQGYDYLDEISKRILARKFSQYYYKIREQKDYE